MSASIVEFRRWSARLEARKAAGQGDLSRKAKNNDMRILTRVGDSRKPRRCA